jgi:membrane-associated phospholipid phosphatase
MGFTLLILLAYIYLLKDPSFKVTVMPITTADRLIGFAPWALPIYLSLWVYVSLPAMLMLKRLDLVEYGAWVGIMCIFALLIFYFWPTAVPPANIDWSQYPGMAFLKGVDASGNACPSLHVATAIFSAIWLDWRLLAIGTGRSYRIVSVIWCTAIVYSTMATKQHVAIDVVAGGFLGWSFALGFRKWNLRKAIWN